MSILFLRRTLAINVKLCYLSQDDERLKSTVPGGGVRFALLAFPIALK